MNTILVVDTDTRRFSRLSPGLEEAGFAVRHATSAFEALTIVERLHPEVVLMPWDAGNMTAPELASALRRDEALGPLSTVLRVDPGHRAAAAAANGTFDLVLGVDECADHELGGRIARFLNGGPAGPDSTDGGPDDLDHFSISGHFGLLDLADLVQTVCSRRKSGTLSLNCGGHVGRVVFEAGLVRHASYRGLAGRSAFSRLFGELRDRRRAPFAFAPMSAEKVRATPSSIGQPAQLLLLDIAVAQDESRWRPDGHDRLDDPREKP